MMVERQFYHKGNLYGITPESNRMVMFDARIEHRATPFETGIVLRLQLSISDK